MESQEGVAVRLSHSLPEETVVDCANKASVFLTEKVSLVYEPDEGGGCVPVDMSREKVFKHEFSAPGAEVGRRMAWGRSFTDRLPARAW